MSKPAERLYIVLDATVLDLGVVEDVFSLMGFFKDGRDSPETLRTRGYLTIVVPRIQYDSVLGAIGPTIEFKNVPSNVRLTIPASYIRCVLEIPDEFDIQQDRFLGRFI